MIGRKVCPDFSIGRRHSYAAPRSAFDKSLHDKEGFVDFLECRGVFSDGHSKGGESDWAPSEFIDHGFEDTLVHLV